MKHLNSSGSVKMSEKKTEPGQEEQIFSSTTKAGRERKALVALDGTAETESGRLTKTNYFKFLSHDIDDYSNLSFTKEQAHKLHQHLSKLSTGSTAMVPLLCGGKSKCPFANRCPLVAIKQAPIGKQCILENQLLKEFTVRYFEEYDIDPHNWTEVGYVNELAEIDIYLMRLKMLLARPENSELVIDQTVGVAPGANGTPIIQKQISPYMEQMDKLQSRKSKIVKLMVGDRQEKYKKEAALKIKLEGDPSSKQAAMRAKLEGLKRAADALELAASSGKVLPEKPKEVLTPEDIIDAVEDEG